MPFAFGQTINLSQSSGTRSGIIPIKWGFCASDALTAGLISEEVSGVPTAALMHIEHTSNSGCTGTFSSSTVVASGNNETTNTAISKTEEGWRMQSIHPNSKEVVLYVITRAGDGGNVEQSTLLGCEYYCSDSGSCCSPDGIACTDCQAGTCTCCPVLGIDGGDAGYYKVTFDLQNYPQDYVWVYLPEFAGGGVTGFGTAQACDNTIKVQLFSGTSTNMNMNNELANFRATPGQDAGYESSGKRINCSPSCNECEVSCLPCEVNFNNPADSSFSTFVKSGVTITIGVTAANSGDFWGPNGDDGYLSDEFGWGENYPDLPVAFVSSEFGGTGATGCSVGGVIQCGSGTVCACEGTTFERHPTTTATLNSGQLIGLVVR